MTGRPGELKAKRMSAPGRPAPHLVCVGGAVLDRKYQGLQALVPGTSNPATGARAFGGVARNVAETLARLRTRVSLVSLVGDDEAGQALLAHAAGAGVDVGACEVVRGARSAEYLAVLQPDGELLVALADMAIFDALSPQRLCAHAAQLESAALVFADCNLPRETLAALILAGAQGRLRLALDAVSVPKSAKLPQDLRGVDLLFLNRDQGAALTGQGDPDGMLNVLRARGAQGVVLTLGAGGAHVAWGDERLRLPAPQARVVDVTGAGDALIAGTLYGLVRGDALPRAVATGMQAARLALESPASVPPDLSPERLHALKLAGRKT